MIALDVIFPLIPIDVEFLLRWDSRLARVGGALTWNQLGARIAQAYQNSRPLTRLDVGDQPDTTTTSSEPAHWLRGKHLVHAVLLSRDPYFSSIRKRLGSFKNLSTPELLFTLSLWLAGQLKLSVSATQPMVAVMLYAVARAGGNWAILQDD
jgi:hypothetical protein